MTWQLIVAPFISTIMSILSLLWVQAEPAGFDREAAKGIEYSPMECIVPGPGLPESLDVMSSNNNVDLMQFEDRFYMGFRSGPTHFASPKVRLIVVSSADRKTWDSETEFSFGCDVREPRFFVFKDKLFLYFFRGGTSVVGFEPQSMYVTERTPGGQWTEPKTFYKPGYVVWRAKEFQGKAYMAVYDGAGIYTTADRPGDVRLLTSDDGYHWEPVSEEPQFTDVSAGEMAFEWDDDGNIVATVRLEVQGALVCTAKMDDLTHWRRKFTPYKYDSALMFRHNGEFYVIARRNVAGPFNRNLQFLPEHVQRGWYLARYSLTRKRTALYKIDPENLELTPLFDFPSTGDTAYVGIAKLDDNNYYVVNYSSDLNGPDWPWLGGQIAGANLYATTLSFPAGNGVQ